MEREPRMRGEDPMTFLVDLHRLADVRPEELSARSRAYQQYLDSVKDRLGLGSRAYVGAEWHLDLSHRQSPHDGWLESMTIAEPSSSTRHEQRSISIRIELLGSRHDGKIVFTYPDVRSYQVSAPAEFERPPLAVGHGDWLVDEVRLSSRGLVTHEILFSRGARWQIEARDFKYEWVPI